MHIYPRTCTFSHARTHSTCTVGRLQVFLPHIQIYARTRTWHTLEYIRTLLHQLNLAINRVSDAGAAALASLQVFIILFVTNEYTRLRTHTHMADAGTHSHMHRCAASFYSPHMYCACVRDRRTYTPACACICVYSHDH